MERQRSDGWISKNGGQCHWDMGLSSLPLSFQTHGRGIEGRRQTEKTEKLGKEDESVQSDLSP